MLPIVDPHRLAEARSLAYHRAVAERLETDPDLIARASSRVARWIQEDRSVHYARQWQNLLHGPLEVLRSSLVADTEEARALRQATPFAGALSPRERWGIWSAERTRAERP
jgi:hypothetical protein